MFSASYAHLAQPALLPDGARPFGLPAFRTLADVLHTYTGDTAIYVIYPRRIETAARTFLDCFDGKTLYAVKANPHPAVIKTLYASGVRAFDVASIREIDLVLSICPDAELYLMNPVKSRRTIQHAYAAGIRHFAFDCETELNKILHDTGHARDLHLHLRLALPKMESANMPLDGKYGADFQMACQLLKQARQRAYKLGVSFHVGSQCMDPADYVKALAYVHGLLQIADTSIDSLDCGGGFPVRYPGMTPPPLEAYLARIRKALSIYGFDPLECLIEPGRALCGEAGSTLARVDLRKGQDLYLNEGAYGSLFDAAQCAWKYPVRHHRIGEDGQRQADHVGYRFFGPTCDSLDQMPGPFMLPADVKEDDWIEICHLGAYGQALASDFNGFQSRTTVAVLTDGPGLSDHVI